MRLLHKIDKKKIVSEALNKMTPFKNLVSLYIVSLNAVVSRNLST